MGCEKPHAEEGARAARRKTCAAWWRRRARSASLRAQNAPCVRSGGVLLLVRGLQSCPRMSSESSPRSSLAYRSGAFINGEVGRPLRILAEYLEPLERFKRLQVHDTVVFFGSARISEEGP